jgi:hypothetical protein
MKNKINHRYEIEIKLGLHDLKDLRAELAHISFAICATFLKNATLRSINTVMGNSIGSSSIKVEHFPDMTKAKYIEKIEKEITI